jgi:hypothetical protein
MCIWPSSVLAPFLLLVLGRPAFTPWHSVNSVCCWDCPSCCILQLLTDPVWTLVHVPAGAAALQRSVHTGSRLALVCLPVRSLTAMTCQQPPCKARFQPKYQRVYIITYYVAGSSERGRRCSGLLRGLVKPRARMDTACQHLPEIARPRGKTSGCASHILLTLRAAPAALAVPLLAPPPAGAQAQVKCRCSSCKKP